MSEMKKVENVEKVELTDVEIALIADEKKYKKEISTIMDWLISVRCENKEEINSEVSHRQSVLTVAKKLKFGHIKIEDGHIIQKLRWPVGDLKELKFKQFYTAGEQAKAARKMDVEGALSMAHNLIAALCGTLQSEIKLLKDKDISTASEVEALYFL